MKRSIEVMNILVIGSIDDVEETGGLGRSPARIPRLMSTPPRLPPTSPDLARDGTLPYFLWWTDATVGDLKRHLRSPDPNERAYWMGALLREANTRDVWLFVTPAEIREAWPDLIRYLGRTRARWAFLLELPEPVWPPAEARGA